MAEDIKKTDKKFGMVSIPLHEYEELRAQGRMITDPDLINVIDKIDELLRVLKKELIEVQYTKHDE
jgi:hypothetical protein